MTESQEPAAPMDASPMDAAPMEGVSEPVRTGVPTVDDVLADVERLDELPLEQHLSVFESAHGALRAALDADPGEPA